jgi:hypothetical protein
VSWLDSNSSLPHPRTINVFFHLLRHDRGAAHWTLVALNIVRMHPVLDAVLAEDVLTAVERNWRTLFAEVFGTYGAIVVRRG